MICGKEVEDLKDITQSSKHILVNVFIPTVKEIHKISEGHSRIETRGIASWGSWGAHDPPFERYTFYITSVSTMFLYLTKMMKVRSVRHLLVFIDDISCPSCESQS